MMKRALQLLVVILFLSGSIAVLAYAGLPYEPIGLTALRLNSSLYAEEPVAEFSADPLDGPLPLVVNFTNESTGDFDECDWDFGDFTASSQCEPQHTYLRTGHYTVTLTISGPGGEDTEIKPEYVEVKPGLTYLPSVFNNYRSGKPTFLPVVMNVSGTATDTARPGGR